MRDKLKRINEVQRDLLNLINAVMRNLDLDKKHNKDTVADYEFLETLYKEQSELVRIQVVRIKASYFDELTI